MLVARSSLECHLFIELHPCECGEARLETTHRLESWDVGLVAIYEGTCPRCRRARQFEFELDPELVPANKFGGSAPSMIVDAGQYLAVADDAARRVPAELASLDDDTRAQARWWIGRAVSALEEVLKFVPEGGDAVPEETLFTYQGREVYAAEPGRFRKARLDAVLAAYRELGASLGA